MTILLTGLAILALVGMYFLAEWGFGRVLRFVFVDTIDWIANQVIKQNTHLKKHNDDLKKSVEKRA